MHVYTYFLNTSQIQVWPYHNLFQLFIDIIVNTGIYYVKIIARSNNIKKYSQYFIYSLVEFIDPKVLKNIFFPNSNTKP